MCIYSYIYTYMYLYVLLSLSHNAILTCVTAAMAVSASIL